MYMHITSILHYLTLHYLELYCIVLYCITLHYHFFTSAIATSITVAFIMLHYIAIQYITVLPAHVQIKCVSRYVYIYIIYTCLYIRREPPRVFAVQRQCPNQPEQLLNLSEEPCLYKHKIETTMVPKTLHHSGLRRTYTFTGISSLQSCQEGVHARRRACKQQAFIRIRIHMHTGPHLQTHTLTHVFSCVHMTLFTVPKSRQQSGHPIRAQSKDFT